MQVGVLDVVSTYAPQACHQDTESNSTHYHELHTVLDTAYAYSPKTIRGDFNARLIKALPNERTAIGPHTFGASTHELTFDFFE